MRRDLSGPQQIVQACHAAIESVRHTLSLDDEHPSVITLNVKNEAQLNKILKRLAADGIEHYPFYEPDRGNELTAIASGPMTGNNRKPFKKYNLVQDRHAPGLPEPLGFWEQVCSWWKGVRYD